LIEILGDWRSFGANLTPDSRFDLWRRPELDHLVDLFWISQRPPATRFSDAGDNLRRLSSNANEEERGGDSRFIECASAEQARDYRAEWNDLASRALEPNVFLEPSFALSLAGVNSGGATPLFLLVWEGGPLSARGRLIALWALVFPRTVFRRTVKAWVHNFCCSGAPLLDKGGAGLELMFQWLERQTPQISALSTPQLRETGPTFALLYEYSRKKGLSFSILTQYERAALNAGFVGADARNFISTRKKKELKRQLRRLNERGCVTFGLAENGAALRDQIEAFMILEARGWKGRKDDAFLNDPDLPRFVREVSRAMGCERKFRIYWLAVDGRMVAGNIVLLSGDTAYFWKTAYDEDFGFASPGVLLTLEMTDRLLHERRILTADSCAVANHPMIDHIWRGRSQMADVMVSLCEERIKGFNGALWQERFRRRLREQAKAALAHFRST
jgi:CelD/BcsL family acetyltransferase involved in cellulose biosynthesis